ncbi:hypothetical protein NW767_015737 [Fusarium falciforme]|nr:hypothetical protein NW767_015737 [Fusarium falciforme]
MRVRQQNREAALRCRLRKCQQEADPTVPGAEPRGRQPPALLVLQSPKGGGPPHQGAAPAAHELQLHPDTRVHCQRDEKVGLEAVRVKLVQPSWLHEHGRGEPGWHGQPGGRGRLGAGGRAGASTVVLFSSYACRGETVVMPRDQAFDDVILGGWEASPTADTTSQIQLGNAAPWVNVNPRASWDE